MQTVVGVLRGGPSKEHEISLQSGAAMLAALDPARYRARDIYIDKSGQWHAEGRPTSPERVLRQMDAALLPLHGEYGESGEVQRLLEAYSVPYAASEPFATYLAAHGAMAKAHVREAGLKSPAEYLVESAHAAEAAAYQVTRSLLQPVVVRSALGGYEGACVVAGYAPIRAAIIGLFDAGVATVLIEEYVRGRELVAGVVEGLRGETLYALLPVELTSAGAQVPARISRVEAEEAARAAKVAHRTLGLRHASESHFVLGRRGLIYLETSSLPRVGAREAFALALQAVGITMREYIEHLLARSLP